MYMYVKIQKKLKKRKIINKLGNLIIFWVIFVKYDMGQNNPRPAKICHKRIYILFTIILLQKIL